MIPALVWLACVGASVESSPPSPPASAEPAAADADDAGAGGSAPQGAERVVVRHILIPYSGAAGAPFGWSLDREDARAQAEDLLVQLRGGADFAALARQHSKDASAARGGFLGSGQRGTWVPAFEQVAFALPVGGLSEVVETEFGFHILQREALEEVRLRHLVVQHKGARGVLAADPAAARSVEQASARAAEALAALEAGRPFDEVARELSDGGMALRGAELGWFLRGELGPAFDAVAFDLAVGGRSGVIQTPFGFHIIERVE